MVLQNALLLMGLFLGMMVCGVPIGFSLAIAALATTGITGQFEMTAIIH